MTSGSKRQAGQAAPGTSAVPVQIRTARPADAPALGRLLAELGYPQAAGELGPRIATLADSDTDTVLVAEVDGQVVGMASLHVTPFFNEGRSRGRITALVVDPTGAAAASAATCSRPSRPPPGGVVAARSS